MHSKDLDRHINRRYISIIHMNGNEIHHCQSNFTLTCFLKHDCVCISAAVLHSVTVARVDYKWTNWNRAHDVEKTDEIFTLMLPTDG